MVYFFVQSSKFCFQNVVFIGYGFIGFLYVFLTRKLFFIRLYYYIDCQFLLVFCLYVLYNVLLVYVYTFFANLPSVYLYIMCPIKVVLVCLLIIRVNSLITRISSEAAFLFFLMLDIFRYNTEILCVSSIRWKHFNLMTAGK